MSKDDPQLLVSTDWLAAHIAEPETRVLDASWYLAGMNRDPKAEYAVAHIPGARFFDIDEISDTKSDLPHMAPPVEKFVSRMRALGIGDGHRVVVYDGMGIFSAARVWWLFRHFGKTNIAVLDGGLPKWVAEGRPVENTVPPLRDRHFTARRVSALVRDVTEVAAATKLRDAQIVDARSAARWRGEAAEPRPGLRSGRIPGSFNVPFTELLTADGTLKPDTELQAVFETAGVDLSKPVITSCGSGVTAAVLSLALEKIGHRHHSLYDGSWAEWGMFGDLKVETG